MVLLSARVEIKWNEDFWKSLGFREDVEALMSVAVDQAVQYAKDIAPYDTGDYQKSIHKEKSTANHRVLYRLVADDWKSAILEARFGVLRQAAAKAKRSLK